MRVVLELCREHGQGPAWWDTLSPGERVLLLADRQLRIQDANKAREAAARAQRGRRG